MIVLSTICCSCCSCTEPASSAHVQKREETEPRPTFRLFPTIIFNTRNSSPLEMYPSRSMSYTLNATACETSTISMQAFGDPETFGSESRRRGLTFELLFPVPSTAERRQAVHKLLEVHGPSTAATGSQTPVSQGVGLVNEEDGTHSSSKMAIILDANGLVAIAGICKHAETDHSQGLLEPDCQAQVVTCLEELFPVDGAGLIPIQLHEPLLQPLDFFM